MSDKDFQADINLHGNQLKGVTLERLPSHPTSTISRYYYNTTDNAIYYFNGTLWKRLADDTPIDYEHTQNSPDTVWTVPHNLGYRPNVHVEDSAGDTLFGKIDYLDTNNLTITFSAPVLGKAYCS